MALNENGLIPYRFEDVEQLINNELLTNIDSSLDLSPDSLMGVLKDIFTLHETYIWELSQDVYDSTNVLSAEDQYLDNLVLLVGNVRQQPTRTRGEVWFQADEGFLLNEGDIVESIIGNSFLVERDTYVTSVDSLYCKIYIDTLLQSEDYTLSVDENVFRRESTPNQTEEEILTDLDSYLQAEASIDTNLVLNGSESYIEVEKVETAQTMELSGTSLLAFKDVITPSLVIAMETGAIVTKANTIANYVPAPDLVTVSNPTDLVTGKNLQTNIELRKETLSQYDEVSGGLQEVLTSTLLAIEDVISAKIIENRKYEVTSNLPVNSYKAIVYGGDNQLIGEALWENTPAGIQCFSDINGLNTVIVDILDFNSQSHIMYFTRPNIKYIWVYVDYTKYSEEVFTPSGEEIMREEIANYGNNLNIGEDVYPDRFYPTIYTNVNGVEESEIYFAITDDLNTPPTYPSDYTQDIISITDEEITNFSPTRVEVQEV